MSSGERTRGITLGELMLIVAVLIIVGALAVPHLSVASGDPTERELLGNLLMLRSQLELYRVQHENRYPQFNVDNPVEPVSVELFVTRLSSRTNSRHQLGGLCGPYMEDLPVNPYNGMSTLRFGTTPGKNMAGWVYNPKEKWLSADDSVEHAQW